MRVPVTDAVGSMPAADAPPGEATRAAPDQPARRWHAPLPLLLVGAPFAVLFVVLAVRALTVDWFPVHDFAFFELRVADVGTQHTPLVGPYSRFGWSHPGPMLFELLAVPYRLLGGRPQGMLVGAVALNAAAVAGILVVARRRGGTFMLVAAALAVAVLLRALGTDVLISPWNPWITVPPMVLLLLLAWSMAVRDWVLLPVTVLVASFLVQTHVAYALVVGAALLVGVGFAAAPARADDTPRRPSRRTVLLSGILLLALWLPPLLDLLFGTQNLAHLVRFFVGGEQTGRGVGSAVGIAARETGPLGPWARGPEELEAFTGAVPPSSAWTLALPIGALAIGAAVSWRRRDRSGLAFVAVAAAAVVATVASIARLDGAALAYLVRFTWAVACVVWLSVVRAIAPALWSRLRDRAPSPGRSGAAEGRVAVGVSAAVSVVLLLVVVVGLARSWTTIQPPEPDESAALQRISAAVVPAVQRAPGTGQVLVRPAETEVHFPEPSSRGLAAGLVGELHRAGVDVRVVDADWQLPGGGAGRQFFGDARVEDGGPVAGTLTVISGSELDTFVPPAGSVELYRHEDRAAVDEARRLEAQLTQAFTEAGHPEAVAAIPEPGLQWVPFSTPELGRFSPQIDRLLALRALRRDAVSWQPRA